MPGPIEIASYLDQLQAAADAGQVDIKQAVIEAGKSDSVYYRWRNGKCEPTLRVARDVMAAINKLALVPYDASA
jgi:hypothetical protein